MFQYFQTRRQKPCLHDAFIIHTELFVLFPPGLIEAIQGSTYYTDREHEMLQKFVVVTPASCRVAPIEGEYGDIVINKMKESLEIKATHGDKFRPYNLSVYSISKGNKVGTIFCSYLVKPYSHTTILQQTTLIIFCQKMENLYN